MCDDGLAPFDNLQDAVDAAADGDTIALCAGTFERAEIDGLDVTIVGAGRDLTTLDSNTDPVLWMTDATVVVEDLNLRGTARDGLPSAVLAEYSDVTLNRVDIRSSDTRSDGVGILAARASEVAIDDAVWEDNELIGYGIIAYSGSDLELSRMTWLRNDASPGLAAGVLNVTYDSTAVVHNNLFAASDLGGSADAITFGGGNPGDQWFYNNTVTDLVTGYRFAVYLQDDSIEFENNIIGPNDGKGVECFCDDVVRYSNVWGNDQNYAPDDGAAHASSISSNPKFEDVLSYDFHLSGFSPSIDLGNPAIGYNDVDGTRNDMGAYGGPDGY